MNTELRTNDDDPTQSAQRQINTKAKKVRKDALGKVRKGAVLFCFGLFLGGSLALVPPASPLRPPLALSALHQHGGIRSRSCRKRRLYYLQTWQNGTNARSFGISLVANTSRSWSDSAPEGNGQPITFPATPVSVGKPVWG
jgi:hypothetical protein